MEKDVSIRLIRSSNGSSEVSQLNALLKAAYQADDSFAASSEDMESTRKRIQEGDCYLAFLSERLVGCLILRTSAKRGAPDWYHDPGVASFGRFAVSPEFQNQGIGSKLIEFAEKRAKQLGFSELALDTSENALKLIKFYQMRGYRFVSDHQWTRTSFKSVVLSKSL